MRYWRRWLPVLVTMTATLACAEALTGPDVAPVASSAAAASGASPRTLSFRELAPGDVVVVAIDASGCFHHDTYDLRLDVGRDGALVLSGSRTSHFVPPGDPVETLRFEARPLTVGEAAGLDRLLAYYRAGPGDGCTSSHTIRLRQLRGDAAIREEAYRDGSCRLEERDGLVSFFGLLRDQEEKAWRAARVRNVATDETM